MRPVFEKLIALLTSSIAGDNALAARIHEKISRGDMARIVNLEGIRDAYRTLKSAFSERASIYYAMKSDGSLPIMRALKEEGSNVEINSTQELGRALEAGFAGEQIIYSNPHKLAFEIKTAYENGVTIFCSQSEDDLQKIAANAPGANVIIRLAVRRVADATGGYMHGDDNIPSRFGIAPQEAVTLIERARELGLNPYGICGHIGTQEQNPKAWQHLIDDAAYVWKELEAKGVHLSVLDLGGGFPSQIQNATPFAQYGEHILRQVDTAFAAAANKPRIVIEPGASLSDHNTFIGTVMDRETRDGQEAVTTTIGHFTAGMWDEDRPVIATLHKDGDTIRKNTGGDVEAHLFGPITTNIDHWGKHALPAETRAGDMMVVEGGTYASATQTPWCLRTPPETIYVDGPNDLAGKLKTWAEKTETTPGATPSVKPLR